MNDIEHPANTEPKLKGHPDGSLDQANVAAIKAACEDLFRRQMERGQA